MYKLTCDLDEFAELVKGEPSHLVRAFVDVAFFVIVETCMDGIQNVFRPPGIVASIAIGPGNGIIGEFH